MNNRLLRHLPAALIVLCAFGVPAAQAAPASVQLRIEGRSTTIYEGPVTTDGKVASPASGGDHTCDGTNNGVNPQPGPTPTSALDDGEPLGNYTWAGTWFSSFEDYSVDRVGPDASTSSEFWGQLVNFKFSSVGGCQERIKGGDEVLWAFDAFSKTQAAKLAGPTSATVGKPFTVTVTNGDTGAPLAGHAVGGGVTGADGKASLRFDAAGIYKLKATRSDSVRSNALNVCVDPAGAAPCTSTDKVAPKVKVLLASNTLATARGRSRTLLFEWQGDDSGGSGVTGYSLDVAEVPGAGANASADVFRPLVARTALTRAYFRGKAGSSYKFRVTAFDRATNRASFESGVISIPVDDRDSALKLSRGWKRLRRKNAWGRTVIRSRLRGAGALLRFSGRRVALIGRKLPRGGRVKVTIDGKTRVVSMRGKPRFRSVVFTSRRLAAGEHTLNLQALGRNPVELDAVAPLP
jgi:hypothetical protein